MIRKGNIKRNLATILIMLGLIGLSVPLSGCGSGQVETLAQETQAATVERGSLAIEITAAGNLALSHTEDLTFDLFYSESGSSGTKGTVGEVLVEEGDTVEEGQVLVTVDKDEWNDELSQLEDAITSKERDLLQAQINLETAEQDLQDSRDNEAVKELALLNAQISLEQAQDDLEEARKIYDWDGYTALEAAVYKAETYYDYVLDRLQDSSGSKSQDLTLLLEEAQEQLWDAQADYDYFVAGHDTDELSIKKKQIEAAEMSLAQAQKDLDKVAEGLALKEKSITLYEGKVTDAQKALADAGEDLEEARSKSPEITAPFAGFITSVNVEGGDEVVTGTVAVQIADPDKFEADILVSEMDIPQVKLGGAATVRVDSLTGLALSANVTHISPTATIQSGVVNYDVKVEILPLAAAEAPDEFQLREGLTVTVSIIVQEKTDVLLVPYTAITKEEGQSYVQVVTPTGTTEKRAIKTGLTDYQFTEVTEGLSEGETVSIPKNIKSTTTTQQPQGGMMIPGMGGPPAGPPPGG